MAKVKEFEKGRLAGLEMALRVVKEGGIKDLERECKARGAYNIHAPYTYKELIEISEKITTGIKIRTIDTTLAMAMHVLQDEFGFGKSRLERFKSRYIEKTECMLDGRLFWEDIEKTLNEEGKIKFTIRDFGGGEVITAKQSEKLYQQVKNKKGGRFSI